MIGKVVRFDDLDIGTFFEYNGMLLHKVGNFNSLDFCDSSFVNVKPHELCVVVEVDLVVRK